MCHVGPIRVMDERQHVSVCVRGSARTAARAKDSLWVQARKALGDKKEESYEEYLLTNDKHEILEGSQTNVFIVSSNGTIVTPRDNILLGSVRQLVLDYCVLKNMAIEFRPIAIHELETAKEVWITSTSRLILSVHSVHCQDKVFNYEAGMVAAKIKQWITEQASTI